MLDRAAPMVSARTTELQAELQALAVASETCAAGASPALWTPAWNRERCGSRRGRGQRGGRNGWGDPRPLGALEYDVGNNVSVQYRSGPRRRRRANFPGLELANAERKATGRGRCQRDPRRFRLWLGRCR